MISVLHVGLPLALPWLTAEECEKISARLSGIQLSMEAAGYQYAVVHASPVEGLAAFCERLRTEPYDAALIGGGVAGDPSLASFKRPTRRLFERLHCGNVGDCVFLDCNGLRDLIHN